MRFAARQSTARHWTSGRQSSANNAGPTSVPDRRKGSLALVTETAENTATALSGRIHASIDICDQRVSVGSL